MRHILSVLVVLFSLLSHAEGAPGASPANRSGSMLTCGTLPQLMSAYLMHHYQFRSMSDTLKKRTVENYLKGLDGSKTLLTKSEAESIRGDLAKAFDDIQRRRDCSVIERLNKDMVKRYKDLESFVRTTLTAKTFKYNDNVELLMDPEKRGYAKTEKDQKDYLTKTLHWQLYNYLEDKNSMEESKKLLIHRYELNTRRAEEVTTQDLYSAWVNAFANALDPHSTYFSPESLEDFRMQMSLSLEGIGASLSNEDGYTVVQEVISGGAADRAKILKTKDKIIAVAQEGEKPQNVVDMALNDVVRLIRGKKGSKVTLTVLRQGASTERLEVTIVRDKVELKDQAAKIKYEERDVNGTKLKLAVIDLPSFYGDREKNRSSYADMRQLLEEMRSQKVDGLMLDLTRNSGGLLDDAVKISGLFLKQGAIVATKDSHDRKEYLADEDPGILFNGPMVVLTSRRSASASEILAGALKDYKRAVIVGEDHTFGKGTVQSVLDLPMGLGAVKITTGMFFIPGGYSTQHAGVPSDVQLPSRYDVEDIGEKTLDYSLPVQKIASFVGEDANFKDPARHWDAVKAEFVTKLKAYSLERVNRSSEFKEMKTRLAEVKKNKGVVRLADMRKRKAEEDAKKNGDKKDKTNLEKILEADAPQYNEGLNILADYVMLSRGQTPKLADVKGKASDKVTGVADPKTSTEN